MLNVLFSSSDQNWLAYEAPLTKAFADQNLTIHLSRDIPAADTDVIIYSPDSTLQDFSPFTKCKAILNLWAGVETIVSNPTLTQPLCRMVDPGLTQGMIEWVTGHTLRYHLGIDTNLAQQDGLWTRSVAPLASDRHVTILGLGQLGQACASTLANIGFNVTGWARSPKSLAGVQCLHGADGLQTALSTAEILILLLPNTPQTDNTLNAETLASLPANACIINPGRGTLIDDTALLAALETGHIKHATLDVFRQEPLNADHPYWAHPNVTVTPHIAAETRPGTASVVIANNIQRLISGEPLMNLVDRAAGY